MMRVEYDDAFADIADRLIARFGGHVSSVPSTVPGRGRLRLARGTKKPGWAADSSDASAIDRGPNRRTRRCDVRNRPRMCAADWRDGREAPIAPAQRGERARGSPDTTSGARRSRAHRDGRGPAEVRSEEHTSELQSQSNLVCRLLLEKKKKRTRTAIPLSYTRTKPTYARD